MTFIKRAAIISGGGSWGAYGGGTLARLNNDYDTVIGVSTGALMSPFVALKEWDMLKLAYTTMTEKNVFDGYWYKGRPISKTGKVRRLTTIISLILGQDSIGTSNALKKMINYHFTENYFDELQIKNKEVLVGTQNYSEIPSKVHYFSSARENFEDFKYWIWCSANFPFLTTLLKKSWKDSDGNFHIGKWSDGGLTDLISVELLLEKSFDVVDIVLHKPKLTYRFDGKRIHGLLDNVNASISAMRHNIEFELLYNKIDKLNSAGIKVNVYWLPRTLETDSLLFNERQMMDWWNEGYETALDKNRIDVFLPRKKRQ